MRRGPVFWYALAILTLSFIAGAREGNVIEGLFYVVVNGVIFVLPVVLIAQWRSNRRATKGE